MEDLRVPADETPAPSPEFEALALLMEAQLKTQSSAAAHRYLRNLAETLAGEPENLASLSAGVAGARAKRTGRAWVARALTTWMARYG